MATKYLDSNGLLYLWQKIRNTFVSDVTWDSTNKKLVRKKKTGTSGAEESVDIVAFSTVATSGSYNDLSNKPTIPTLKNVFGKVKVGSTTIEADTTQDTLELAAGSNITLTPDATNDKVTIAATDTTYESKAAASGGTAESLVTTGEKYTWNNKASTSTATTSANGLMSSTDKTKLNGIAEGAEVNVNADWNAASGDAQILNKPTLGGAAAKGVITSIAADSNDLPTVTAVKQYVSTAVSGGAAFQGTAPTTFAPTDYKAGWYWVVGTAGTYVGEVCEPGDMIFATANGTTYSAADFDVIQTNLDITSITNAEIDTIVAA